jgi:hypothetical protein
MNRRPDSVVDELPTWRGPGGFEAMAAAQMSHGEVPIFVGSSSVRR